MRKPLIVLSLVAAMLACAGVAIAGLNHNPANSKRLISKPLEDYRYDSAKDCRSRAPKGTRSLEGWLRRNVRGQTWGIYRCERWGPGSASLHAESRAIDWHLDARVHKEKRAAMKLIGLLLERDRKGNKAALARRMGVQGLIFNCRAWWSGQERLGKYSYCYTDGGRKKRNLDPTAAHKDHIHIELNWAGARENTSFWGGGRRSKAGARTGGHRSHAGAADNAHAYEPPTRR